MKNFFCKVGWRWRDVGWSEVYPISAADYSSADTLFKNVLISRASIMAPDVSLTFATVSDSDVSRDSFASTTTVTVGTWGGPDLTSFDPNWALRLRVEAGVTQRCARFIHAVPTGQVDAEGEKSFTGPYDTAYGLFATQMVGTVCIAKKQVPYVTGPHYSFTPTTAWIPKVMGEKKCGRPFGLRLGRRAIA